MKRLSPKPRFDESVFDRPARSPTRNRLLIAIPIAAGHLALFLFMSSSTPRLTPAPLPELPVMAELREPPPPPAPQPVEKPESSDEAAATPAPPAPTKPEKPAPPKTIVEARLARTPPPEVQPLPAAPPGPPEPDVVLGDAALAGATVAGSGVGSGGGSGSGSGGGQCDMVRRLQDALRGDPEVRAAVARSHTAIAPRGKAILVWNGEWLRSPGQDGKGLAGVRQAIAMEVAFAPPACKTQPMRGLVVISFNDSPTAPKLALGSREWRWSELLSARR